MKNDGIFRLLINDKTNMSKIVKIGSALSSEIRLKMLLLLYNSPRTIVDISNTLGLKNSTTIFHLDNLVKSDLVLVKTLPAKKGKVQLFTLNFTNLNISINTNKEIKPDDYIESMPIGMYIDAEFDSYFGLTTDSELYRIDIKDAFNEVRKNAQMLWFDGGFLKYKFSNLFLKNGTPTSISFSMELCSETQYYNNDYKSDIYIDVNGIQLGYFLSPGDFGGKRGIHTPQWWPTSKTQYGILVNVEINNNGTFINGTKTSKITIEDLFLQEHNYTELKIYTLRSSEHYGGISLFGRKFGNYPQDIIFTVKY